MTRRPRVDLVLDVFGEVQRSRERDCKHEEERDHGHGKEGVQTPAAGGARTGDWLSTSADADISRNGGVK